MRFAWVLLGSILCTTILLSLELSHDDTRLAYLSIPLIIVLIREQLSVTWWYRPFFLAWLGTSFLVADLLLDSLARRSKAPLVTFGPGFLIMALYEVIRHRRTLKQSNAKVHP
jgi:hypothetical protein